MKCPRDGQPLALARIEECIVDWCPLCHGLWLDYGQLERLLDSAAMDIEGSIEVLMPVEGDFRARTAGYMRCPKCPSGRLQGITYTLEHRIRIHRCEECLGVWLDSSELDGILREKQNLDVECSIAASVAHSAAFHHRCSHGLHSALVG